VHPVDRAPFDATKLAAARLKAAQLQPFLGVALFALSPCSAPGLDTFAVDERWRLFVDPAALDRWSVEEVAGVLLHEVGHVVRFHSARARAQFVDISTARLWNIAGDAEINDDLVADGATLPAGGVTPRGLSLPSGKMAEFYYHRLKTRRPGQLPHVDCGSGAHGVAGSVAAVEGQVAGIEAEEADLLRRAVALAIRSSPRRAGHGGGGWSRWAESMLDPVVDWRRLLAGAIRGSLNAVASGRSDYSYSRPARRHLPGVILPALVRRVPTVAAILDTSASVGDRELSAAWSEVLGMMRAVGVRRDRVRVWSADTEAHRLQLGTQQRAELIGGGGTNMATAIAVALRERPVADLVIVLTDGETPWPAQQPGRPVIVALLGDVSAEVERHVPSWATAVRVPLDDFEGAANSTP
jgi:predicted metal-dependent peptidase